MYEAYFGLRERPFDLTTNPRFLFLTPKHREALSTLRYGTRPDAAVSCSSEIVNAPTRFSRGASVTVYEARYRLLRPYDHPLRQYVYRTLKDIERQAGRPLSILDVGGRRSQYTIGLKSRITITDIPKETALQERLDLGTTDSIRGQLMARRSNVADYVIDDMTRTQLAAGAYDVVVAIEVIEHVDDDEAFVRNVSKVLAPGGHVVLTTPNGDFRPVPYADHRRHYTRRHLSEILRRHLSEPRVGYLVNEGALMRWGTVTPSFRRLARTLASPVALGLATHLERLGVGGSGPHRKLHLVASARKAH